MTFKLNLKFEICHKESCKGQRYFFDDFSMVPFSRQNAAYRKFFRFLDLEILELPAGQGLVVV